MDINVIREIAYLVASVLFIVGIKKLGGIRTARKGNLYAALGMLLAIIVTLLDTNILPVPILIVGIILGSVIGVILALQIQMTGMPQMVAFLNGLGGIASLMVAVEEYVDYLGRSGTELISPDTGIAVALSVIVGGITFTGSMIAFGKLQGIFTEKSVMFPMQHPLNALLILAVLVLGVLLNFEGAFVQSLIGMDLGMLMIVVISISLLLGITLVIPIGGADMPVVIALLNSYSGIAAAMTGFVLKNNVLIITGSLVGASGIILTNIMCVSMNRSLLSVLLGGFGATTGSGSSTETSGKQVVVKEIGVEETAMVFEVATSVIIIPGYGMAVAQAQHVIKEMADILIKRGTSVKFAIHPVAGRMPGHMNVLLAEANVPYEILLEMDEINDEFNSCDVALVIGANDVVNPAARYDTNSPIFGMPILNADKARTVVINKRSLKPGYAGIDNELFGYPNALMYLGDAKDAISKLNTELKALK